MLEDNYHRNLLVNIGNVWVRVRDKMSCSYGLLHLPPSKAAGGSIQLPGLKSISNRALLLAALSNGETRIANVLEAEDTNVLKDALRSLGCEVRSNAGSIVVRSDKRLSARQTIRLSLGNAGTAMRPLAAVLALTAESEIILEGAHRMHERPIADLVNALLAMGCDLEYLGVEGYPPLRIRPGSVRLPEVIQVRGDASSQFVSALLMALPLISNMGDIRIQVIGNLVSKPYVDMTLRVMESFGVRVEEREGGVYCIPNSAHYSSPGCYHVEGDASAASYFMAIGALGSRKGQEIVLEGVGSRSIQGDISFCEALTAMGADVRLEPDRVVVCRGVWPLKAIDLDVVHMPDAAMTLAVLALYADGPSLLRGVASWRIKECDRIVAMATELAKLGACVEKGSDFIHITPPKVWRPAMISTYNDHRMAMCFSLASFNPIGASIYIENPDCVKKTYPDYFKAFFSVCHH